MFIIIKKDGHWWKRTRSNTSAEIELTWKSYRGWRRYLWMGTSCRCRFPQ